MSLINVEFTVVECCVCGSIFQISTSLDKELLRTHKAFYCPAGHSQHYTGESDEAKARREKNRADVLEAKLEEAQARINACESAALKKKRKVRKK